MDNKLANREAQPVAVPEYLTYLSDTIISNVLADDDDSPMANAARILAREVKFWRSQPLFTAPPAPAIPDAVDIFADQVIGTKTKIIRMPAPLNVPQEGIRVYLNADKLIKIVESQGYQVIIEVQ
ncbi:TPA: hypothetical protein SMF84_001417 [Serratia marcescens]|nr:hypothetical protein [Serratia marcescens]HEJ7182469.1 hypothetical protein [Serratia marcescens]HEJ7211794.1 hypothetical protein [Serratia marcescens]